MVFKKEFRKEFEQGKPIKVKDLSELIEVERTLKSFYPSLKWGGEEPLVFLRIDIRKEEFPIILFREKDSLYWDNAKKKGDYIKLEKGD